MRVSPEKDAHDERLDTKGGKESKGLSAGLP